MKIKYILAGYLLASQALVYPIEQENVTSNDLVLFMKNYLENNKNLLGNIDTVCGHCEENFCEFELLEKNQVVYLYNIKKYFSDKTEAEKITVSKYYANGSFINDESFFLQRKMTRFKRGDYFKPSIDGSWLANERAQLLKKAREHLNKKPNEIENKTKESDKLKNIKDYIESRLKKIEEKKNTIATPNIQESKNNYFFKPSIDGSWLANERANLLKIARKKAEKDAQ